MKKERVEVRNPWTITVEIKQNEQMSHDEHVARSDERRLSYGKGIDSTTPPFIWKE